MRIKRVGPLSCAKIAGVIYAAMGCLIGICFTAFALLAAAFHPTSINWPGSLASPVEAVVTGLFAAVAYGALGFFSGLIGAWVYNFVASRVGGVEIDLA